MAADTAADRPTFEITAEEAGRIPWQEVNSSNVAAIALAGVKEEECALFVRFKSGQAYRYEGVPDTTATPARLYELLTEADADPDSSVGKTFNNLIRKAGAPSARLVIKDTL